MGGGWAAKTDWRDMKYPNITHHLSLSPLLPPFFPSYSTDFIDFYGSILRCTHNQAVN